MLKLANHSLDYYVGLLEQGAKIDQHFAFTRYGDGEFLAIQGHKGANCDGHEYFVDMSSRLANTLGVPHLGNYYYGILPVARRVVEVSNLDAEFPALTEENLEANVVQGEVMLWAFIRGEFMPMLEHIRRSYVIFVGPDRLYEFSRAVFGPDIAHCHVPLKNSWTQYRTILRNTKWYIERVIASKIDKRIVVLTSCGPPAKVLIYDLWNEHYKKTTYIDIGSMLDGFLINPTRSYQRAVDYRYLLDHYGSMT